MTFEKKSEKTLTSAPLSNNINTNQKPAASEVPTAGTSNIHPRIMSENEAFISDLVKEAPKDVSSITFTRQPGLNVLELPEECKQHDRKKYRYRWLAKDKNLSAYLRTSIWVLCTRENSPYIKSSRFKTHGAVEQAGMLLAFTTEELAQRRELEPAQKSAALVKHYTEELPDAKNKGLGFYKPDSAGLGADNEEGLEEGRDFSVGR